MIRNARLKVGRFCGHIRALFEPCWESVITLFLVKLLFKSGVILFFLEIVIRLLFFCHIVRFSPVLLGLQESIIRSPESVYCSKPANWGSFLELFKKPGNCRYFLVYNLG